MIPAYTPPSGLGSVLRKRYAIEARDIARDGERKREAGNGARKTPETGRGHRLESSGSLEVSTRPRSQEGARENGSEAAPSDAREAHPENNEAQDNGQEIMTGASLFARTPELRRAADARAVAVQVWPDRCQEFFGEYVARDLGASVRVELADA